MIISASAYVTLGLSILLFILTFGYYWTVLRKIKGFPIYHLFFHVMHSLITKKKDTPFTNVLFQIIRNGYQKHAKEGFFMSYSLSPQLFVFSEESMKLFLNDKAAINKPMEYSIIASGIGYGLITSNGERWKQHKKLISPAFQLGKLKEKIPLFNDHALALIENLKELEGQSYSDYSDAIKRHYFNGLSESVFGVKLSTRNKTQFLKYYDAIDKSCDIAMYKMYQPWLWPKIGLKLLPSGTKILKLREELDSFPKNVILEMKKCVTLNKELHDTDYFSQNFRKSLTYILLKHHLTDPSFTFEDLHGHVSTFMAAGYDTTSYTTIWCLFMLGLYPEIQEKAFQEVQSSCQNYITYEEMNSFTYLEAVIMETLRLYPTVPVFARSLNEDVQFGEYKVHKGTFIGFPVYFWHRNPEIYPDPETFDPERFLNTQEIKPWHHIPFAEGTRVCIGKQFAIMEMKIFLAHILRNFKITSLDKREDIQLCLSIVLTPAKPLRITFTPRSNPLAESCLPNGNHKRI